MPKEPSPITHCPKTDNGKCDRIHYAKGLCKSCYNAKHRAIADANYEATPKAQTRRERYEASEKGRRRKRRWWNKNRASQ